MELISEIKAIGFSCTYGSYKSPPSLPYTIVVESNDNDMKADNHNYKKIRGHQLEYYNSKKYPLDEQKIEDKLDELRLPYIKSETEIESEGLYQIVYEFQLI
ncbi:MAG: phage-like protein [Candidatus Frackibacter sp. T328-2]|nr:MAG: phage-like protein [Candidatus Frackibacter sp. T328-2]